MHALRHFYASVLLDAGESIRALSQYLGHSDPGFTLRTYTHLMPSSEGRTRKAVDSLYLASSPHDHGPGTAQAAPPRSPGRGTPSGRGLFGTTIHNSGALGAGSA
ncbi:tyrosine-type recombinase/integrase [Streptomyces albogriseolus]|uniref:tyrosine-type recombinase/integrase n=1 Tax=Streptomyces albogriseolus TaxID=1887 RepID=UPI0036F783B1